jgi:hypothetical protein
MQAAVLWHLRHYRHATLSLSWLDGAGHSTLERLRAERTTTFDMEGWLSALNGAREMAHKVRRVVLRVSQAIAEIGYDNFVLDVTSKEFVAGNDSPLGSADVMLVPGERPDRLPGIVVAVTKGKWGRARLGLTRVMQLIQAILPEGQDQIRFLLILCDTWDSAEFRSQHLGALRKFPWLQFLVLGVGSPDNVLAPLAID